MTENQKMLDAVNKKSWAITNKVWLLAIVVAAVFGFIIGHVV